MLTATKPRTKSRIKRAAPVEKPPKGKTASAPRPKKTPRVKSATVAESVSAITEAELLSNLKCLTAPMPTESDPEHELVSFVARHHQAIEWMDKTNSLAQHRAGKILNILYEKWDRSYTQNVEQRCGIKVRTALNYRDIATHCTQQEARDNAPAVLYEKVKKIKDATRNGLTIEGLKKRLKSLVDDSKVLREIVESEDKSALKSLFDEPSTTIKELDGLKPYMQGLVNNVISIGKALDDFAKNLKEITK